MSAPLIGIVRNPEAETIGLPVGVGIHPLDSGVMVHIVGGGIVPIVEAAASIIYATPDAAGGGTGFEHHSIIPAAAIPAALASIYASLQPAPNITSYFIQIHLGVLLPAAGAIPLLVGDSIVPPGGNEQWIPPDEVDRAAGFVVVVSTTQAFLTDPGLGVTVLRTRAWGR